MNEVIDSSKKLTEHFTLGELTSSQTATRLGLDNTPGAATQENLKRLCEVLEQVRLALNAPLIISSGYRSRQVNAAIGGSSSSAHCQGCAADFTAPSFGTTLSVCQKIMTSGILFDQLIYEGGQGGWVHLGLANGIAPRREVLTWRKGEGYQKGLVP